MSLVIDTAGELQRAIGKAGLTDSMPHSFFEELVDNGIETVEQFEDAYQGCYDNEAHFVEEILNDCYQSDLPSWVCIDYQSTWDSALRFDYFSIEGATISGCHIFRNI